jgi:hypothetical protein
MKRFAISLFLALMIAAVFGSHVHAAFITDITEFVQFDGSGTFTDPFDDGAEPPSGPYVVEGTFGPDRESGGSLELDSDDGMVEEDEKFLAAAVSDSTYFFSTGSGGHVIGTFDFTGGLPSDSFFGIEILNFVSDGFGEIEASDPEPATYDEAWMGVSLDAGTGHLIGVWGDESSFDPLGSFDFGVVSSTTIGLKLEISTSDVVTAYFDYAGSGFITHTGSSVFTTIGFDATTGLFDDIYTGGFAAGEAIPEPTTIALLGLGLAGFAGAAARRRLKKMKH